MILQKLFLKERPADASDNSRFSFPITNISDEIGLMFFFEVELVTSRVLSSDTGYVYKAVDESQDFATTGLVFGSAATDYQIVSFPYQFDNKNYISVLSDLAPADSSKWRLFHWNTNLRVNEEFSPSGLSLIKQGEGYWLIIKDRTPINLPSGKTATVESGKPFVIILSDGHNQIGNPYSFNVSWDDILTENNLPPGSLRLRTFDAPNNTLQDNSTTLDAFSGGFVFTTGSFEPMLKIPFRNSGGRESGDRDHPELNSLSDRNWQVRLNLTGRNIRSNIFGIGMDPNAEVGLDIFDEVSWPAIGNLNAFEIIFPHPEAEDPNFNWDVVPTSPSYIWEFNLTNDDGEEIIISWDHSLFGENEKELYLHDLGANRIINMRDQLSYYVWGHTSRNFKIYFGNQLFIDENLKPESITMGPGFPNPFVNEINIPFALPASDYIYEVIIVIYNSHGQKVETIFAGQQEGGFHEISYNTKQYNKSLIPGLYLVRMAVSNGMISEEINIKIIKN